MSLVRYKEKRSKEKTPEPFGGKPTGKDLRFVIQKHAASHLHYDFRLEMQGVLKSWAVPKGPSTDPKIKHLAMMVEDHPYDYRDFEGIIPKGEYGGGTVIVWDEGTYEIAEPEDSDLKKQEKQLVRQLYSGKLKFILHGKKLKGEYTLVKTPARGDNAWLLMKVDDKYASTNDVTKKDKSVISGKTLETMSGDKNAAVWSSNRKSEKATKKLTTKKSVQIKKGFESPMPSHVAPMLCTLTREPIADDEYLYEIKWDGYRIISYVNGGKVRMDSRSALDYTAKYPRIATALKELKRKVVLDGEVVVFNDEGMPDFDALQKYNGHDTPISYCVFDILWLDGNDLTQLPLVERKEILKSLTENNETIRYSESFDDGIALYEQSVKMNLEGIVAKRKQSTYQQDARGNDWLKTPTRKRQEFVIGGWADSDKSRTFRSLLFGAYNANGDLEWIGRSGGGYKDKEMPGILKQLQKLEVDSSPFSNKVLDTKGAVIHWVKPHLVANFEFATWTKSGRIRKPATFLGFRKDKKALDVVREVPKPLNKVEEEIEVREPKTKVKKQADGKRGSPSSTSQSSNWPKLEKIKPTSQDEMQLEGCAVELTDVDRNVWKDIPKATLIEYYHSIANVILPHIKDRPLSLHVKPFGATAEGLYIKDMEGRQPECGEIFSDERRHPKPGKNNTIDYLVCNNEATLLYLINLGCIDINPWMSRIQAPQEPDFINIDLDPSDDDFEKVIQTALAAKKVLAKYKLKTCIKTSGKTGLHIFIPVSGIGFEAARKYSETLGEAIHELVPDISTTEVSIAHRKDKVFIDPSQNDYADTLAAAYSVRPYHIPTVSTPLEWSEIKKGLNPQRFTIDTILTRLKKKGDLFKGVLDKKVAAANAKQLSVL